MSWLDWIAQGLRLFAALHPVAAVLLAAWVFWQLFVYTMGLYRAKLTGRLKGFALLLCSPGVVLAFTLDVVFQFTVFTVVFADLPREMLVTKRLRRYVDGPDTWRKRWADYFCKHLLDPFDPTGSHCDSDPPVYTPP